MTRTTGREGLFDRDAEAADGELLVRGAALTPGYLNRPDATAELFDSDGWLQTGDLATIDDEGRVRIVDRKKEMFISSAGHNMSPANIEAKLKASSPLIAQPAASETGALSTSRRSPCEVAAGDPRLGPVGVLQRLREDDLRDLVHRSRVVARRCRPDGGHLLVRDPTHQVSTRGPHRVEDPALDGRVPTPVAPRV
jgi:acyl-CoA synthetase (AMP-forming)/AMP-acid ligase II